MPLAKLLAAKTSTHHRCLAAVLTASVGVGLGACGDEKKASTTSSTGAGSTAPGGGTDTGTGTGTGTDSNTTVPAGGGDTPVTGTNLAVTLDDVAQPAGVYAFYGAPNSSDTNAYLSILPYDYFDWVSQHDYASVPKTAKGSAARLNLTAIGVTANSSFPVTYHVKTDVNTGDVNAAFSAFDGACNNTGRRATGGTITVESWTGTGTSTVISGRWQGITLFDNANGAGKKSSAADGTFMTSTAVKARTGTVPAASADPAACNPVVYK